MTDNIIATSQLLFGQEAKDKILAGVEKIYRAVSTTLGPRGGNVAISKCTPQGYIYTRDIIHDGVGVANSIDLPDQFENIGVQVLREAAAKTVDDVGDGTTVTIVLAEAIIRECMKIIATGVNPMALRKGLESGRDILLKEMEKHAVPVKGLKEETYIATISAEDEKLGKLVAETLHEVGVDGIVTIEPSKSSETRVEHQLGMQMENGYMHPLFMTNPEERTAVIENPYILVTDREISTLVDMAKLLEELHSRQAGLVIIAPNFGGEALPLLIQNKMAGNLKALAIKAPSFGLNQKNTLQDLAVITGAKYITEEAGYKLEDITLADLGRADYVKATFKDSIIVGGKGKKAAIDTRVAEIKQAIIDEESEFELVKIKERLGKMTNGVSVIYVGGYTEVEMKERKERVDDSVHATRAAMQKGIIPGGEIIFLRIRDALGGTLTDKILYHALQAPFDKLVSNAGEDAGELRAKLNPQTNVGYDVSDLSFKDFLEAGIVDPVLVPMKALENAVSVAIALISVNAMIVPLPLDEVKEFVKKK